MIFIYFYFIKIEIPLGDVLSVTKEKTAFIIPNAIGVQTTREKVRSFSSYTGRDEKMVEVLVVIPCSFFIYIVYS